MKAIIAIWWLLTIVVQGSRMVEHLSEEVYRLRAMVDYLNNRELKLNDDQIPFQEEIEIDGVSVNYYYGLVVLRYFPTSELQQPVLNSIRTFRAGTFSWKVAMRECKMLENVMLLGICIICINVYINSSIKSSSDDCNEKRPSFFWEETERRRLKELGYYLINTGSHSTDLLIILNQLRGGEQPYELSKYYLKRFQIYGRIYKGRDGSSLFLKVAQKLLEKELGFSKSSKECKI